MPEFNVHALVDNDLSQLFMRYRSLTSMLRLDHVELDDVLPFLDDVNQQFEILIDRLSLAETP